MRILGKYRTTAAEWFVKLRTAPATRDTDKAFRIWLASDSENETDYELCELTDALARELRHDAALRRDVEKCADLAADYRRTGDRTRQTWYAPIRVPVAMTAAFALLLVLAVGIAVVRFLPTTYQTRVGEQRTVVLEDASVLTLNTNTRLSVRYSNEERRIRLERGEAFFSVAKDKNRPFEVFAGGGVVRAVGTSFDVDLNGDEIRVAVLEGIVDVTPTAERSQSIQLTNSQQTSTRLASGQAVRFWSSGAIADVEPANIKRINAWRVGQVEFEDLRLSDAIAEHNRYSDRKIIIGNDNLKDWRVSGVFRIGDINSLLFLLENSLELSAVRNADVIVLLPKSNSTTTADFGDRKEPL